MRVVLLVVLLALPLDALAEGWPSLATPPSRQGGGEKDAALIIGVESYIKLPHVVGAADNARAWYAYLTGTLGVTPAAVQLVLDEDASKESIETAADRVAKAVKPGGTLWLVFIGHGAPSADGKDGVLVGFDALQTAQSLYARSLGQQQLLARLDQGAQARTLLVLDACFSGRSSTGSLVPGLQPVVLLRGNLTTSRKPVVALTAAKHDQFAGALPGGNVPAFSYLALGGLRGWADADGNGVVTAQELVGYSNQMLSTLAKDRTQTPEVAPEQATAAAVARVAKAEQGPPLGELVLWLSQRGKGTVGTASTPSGKCPAGMAFIPGGTFVMGDRRDRVTVASYCLDVTEVTVDAWDACVRLGGCGGLPTSVDWPGMSDGDRKYSTFCNANSSGRGRHPANCVDWNQATAFCAGLSKRLPTEEEWEWAARGGERGTEFPWGNEKPGRQVCWSGEGSDLANGSRRSTCPVGSFASGDTPQGVHDLAGNVWEWTSSQDKDSPSRQDRGGGWGDSAPSKLRAAVRNTLRPTIRNPAIGFRCARTP